MYLETNPALVITIKALIAVYGVLIIVLFYRLIKIILNK